MKDCNTKFIVTIPDLVPTVKAAKQDIAYIKVSPLQWFNDYLKTIWLVIQNYEAKICQVVNKLILHSQNTYLWVSEENCETLKQDVV